MLKRILILAVAVCPVTAHASVLHDVWCKVTPGSCVQRIVSDGGGAASGGSKSDILQNLLSVPKIIGDCTYVNGKIAGATRDQIKEALRVDQGRANVESTVRSAKIASSLIHSLEEESNRDTVNYFLTNAHLKFLADLKDLRDRKNWTPQNLRTWEHDAGDVMYFAQPTAWQRIKSLFLAGGGLPAANADALPKIPEYLSGQNVNVNLSADPAKIRIDEETQNALVSFVMSSRPVSCYNDLNDAYARFKEQTGSP